MRMANDQDQTFHDADFYDCVDSEGLTHTSPEEAIEELIDAHCESECDVSELIRTLSPITVTAHKRMDGPGAEWIANLARNFVDHAAERFDEEWGDQNDGDNGLNAAVHNEFRPKMAEVLAAFFARGTVWNCERVGSLVLSATEVEAMMRKHRPEWWA